MNDLKTRLTKSLFSYASLLADIQASGGKPVVVGGAVRDCLLGLTPSDIDLEIYHMPAAQLEAILKKHAPVKFVGKHFGVYALPGLEIALPRQDQKISKGHQGFSVTTNPFLAFEKSAERRDFTINSMGYDLTTHTLIDPFDGQKDLRHKILRATSQYTFAEDPLRGLRAVEMAGRFGFTIHPTLLALMAQLDLSELPSERITREILKIFLGSRQPSIAFKALAQTKLLGTFPFPLPWQNPLLWPVFLEALDQCAQGVEAKRFDAPLIYFLAVMLYFQAKGQGVPQAPLAYFTFPKKLVQKAQMLLEEAFILCKDNLTRYDYFMVAYTLSHFHLDMADLAFFLSLIPSFRSTHEALTEKLRTWPLMSPSHISPLITGNDLLKKGIPPGPVMGQKLKEAQKRQYETGCQDKERLLNSLFIEGS